MRHFKQDVTLSSPSNKQPQQEMYTQVGDLEGAVFGGTSNVNHANFDRSVRALFAVT